MAIPYTFGSLSGTIPASYLDANFAWCAAATDLTALTAVVAALPSASIPLKPLAGGSAGAGVTLAKTDHQHPPQSALPNLQTGTSYTLLASDDGGVVELNNAGAITLTLPTTLPAGFSCLLVQTGVGQVTLSGTFSAYSGLTKCAGQYAQVGVYVSTNAGGSSAVWRAGGTMA